MTSNLCPLSNISFVFWLISESAKTNADQLDFHRALHQQQQQDQNEENPKILFTSFDRSLKSNDPLYQKSFRTAMYLLKNFGGRENSNEQYQFCKGVYDHKNCFHVDVVAALFSACKFVGTQDIMFVSYDSILVKAVEEILKQRNHGNEKKKQDSAFTNIMNEDDVVPKNTKVVDPSKKINLFAESDDDEEEEEKNESKMKRKSNANSEDDIIVEKKSEDFCHDSFVAACVRKEKDFMRACSYFADVPDL